MGNYVYQIPTNDKENSQHDVVGHPMPARAFFFAVVDEVGADGFLVRKIYVSPDDVFLKNMNLSPLQQLQEIYPEKYGLASKDFGSTTSIAEHVMGNNKSAFISTSELFPGGSPRFDGKSIFIDIAKAEASGAKRISTFEILTELGKYKNANPHLAKRIAKISGYVNDVDKEVLLNAERIPARAIFTESTMKLTAGFVRCARVVTVFGIIFTAYDLDVAANESYKMHSIRPMKKEIIRQVGGWGGMWTGMRLGAAAGSMLGIESGPGVIITGAIGGIIGGAIGYFGSRWIDDQILSK